MGAGLSPQAYAARAHAGSNAQGGVAASAEIIDLTRALAAARVRALSARKRLFDLALASTALLTLAPLLLLIWLAIRLTSTGPGLYWSARAGRGGRVFLMPKFRTMLASAPQTPRETLEAADTLVTPLGKLLRRWSLDELPQLFSILKGDMSFIGPRPLMPEDPAHIARLKFPASLAVRPGLSGLAQVRGRNLVSPRRKARLDALYARVRSGPLDIALIGRTAIVLVTGRGFI
ncbi:MAG: sugar transferase [Hyphomonadaceae bacterium]|nr:sugar transferase [Hyphomonadaceae bacterium]